METTKIKRFATEARKVLMQGVAQRLLALGFSDNGTAKESPELLEGGAIFNGEIVSVDFYNKWQSLQHAISLKKIKGVVEEAAYTWFNRFVAIRILEKNNLVPPILQYESDDTHIPVIVVDARQGRVPQIDMETREKLNELLQDDSLTAGQFQILIVAFCHSNAIINKCFGNISDYTELLLPQNIFAEGGFVSLLNHTEFITDEDFRSPELIGWLYQFYISDRKDEVFAKRGKYDAEEIPAATQIFTPNWIVKYMVQNTVGRIYLDNNPYDSDIKKNWKYLVEPAEKPSDDSIYKYDELTDLKVADLACGSGHILNECFDILFDLYRNDGFSTKQAVENIFTKNITGIDIDTRAKQLATFALLLKACQKDSSFADAHCMPRIYDMPEPYPDKDNLQTVLREFIMGDNGQVIYELSEAIKLMDNASSLGSIMKFNISEYTRNIIDVRMNEYEQMEFVSENIHKLMPYMRIILALTEKYAALIMNPPYMGRGNMNNVLSDYVLYNYLEGKADLCTTFMMMQAQKVSNNGFYANIIPPSWMFLTSFESLRKSIILNNSICSLLHLSRGIFGADFGSVSTVLQNCKSINYKGTYFRLIERTFQEFDQKHLKLLFEKTLENHDFRYYFKDYTKDVKDIVYSENGAKIYYSNVSQLNFEKIPNTPIGYWISSNAIKNLENDNLGNIAAPRRTIQCGNVVKYIRFWFEVENSQIEIESEPNYLKTTSQKTWFRFSSGGCLRKWYGNTDSVLYWKNNGQIIKNTGKAIIPNEDLYFLSTIGYNRITSSGITARYYLQGILLGDATSIITPHKRNVYFLGLLNSKVCTFYMKLFNPTLAAQTGSIANIPIADYRDKNTAIEKLVNQNIAISKLDWDAHETSWDFEQNELLALNNRDAYCDVMREYAHFRKRFMLEIPAPRIGKLEWLVSIYKTKWETKFFQLHANEEELNRQFIEIYGLQDELTPDVPLEEITILQQGEISISDDNQLVWHEDVIIKQLISYAVGCMMGRYSIDKKGLILANQGDGLKEYQELVPNSRFKVDDDGIIPLMSEDSDLNDNATLRFKEWLKITFGEKRLVDNLNYVEKCLGKSIDEYFVKDFWKDHKKMYQNRPIYWLFSSKNKAFQCLAYMHRMDAYTAEHIRAKYLLPHIDWLVNKQREMQENAAALSSHERRELDNITKRIDDCREYHDRLHTVADHQIHFDLDDGVVVNYAKFGDVLAKIK